MSTSNAIGGLMGATPMPAAGANAPSAANDASGGDGQFAGLMGASPSPSPSPSPGAAPATPPGPIADSDAGDSELPTVELDEAAALLVWLPWMTPPAAGAPAEGAPAVPANAVPGSSAAELTLRAGTLPAALASGLSGANAAALPDGIAATAAAVLAAQSAGGDGRNAPVPTGTSLSPSALAAAFVPAEPSAVIPVGLPLAASADAAASTAAAAGVAAGAAAGAAAQLKTLAADIVEAMAGERGGESGESRPDARLSSPTSLRDGPRTGFELNVGGGTQRFADTLADGVEQRMQWMAERGIGRAQIRLTPAELGVIDIDLQLDGKHVRAEFSSANADVRQALESQLPRLRDMFQAHGMTLTQADVGHRQDAQSGAESGQKRGDEGFAGHAGFDAADDETLTTRIVGQRLPNGLLDEYA